MSQNENTKTSGQESTSEGKNISFKINVPEGAGTKDIKSTTESSGFDRSPGNDLELTTYETQSIDENVEPWKRGPWYKDDTKRRWFAFGVIVTLIIVVIIVVPVSVANAIKQNK